MALPWNSIETLQAAIQNERGAGVPAKTANRIIDALCESPNPHAWFAIEDIARLAGLSLETGLRDLVAALNILCQSRYYILGKRYRVKGASGHLVDVPDSAMLEARLTGVLVHPETQEPVTNYEDGLCLCFMATPYFLDKRKVWSAGR